MAEWKVCVDPRAKDSPHDSVTIAYLPDQESAETDAEGYAELIEQTGNWPPNFDVDPRNPMGVGMVRRLGKASWLVRSDLFEFERETSYDDGYGILRVRRVW